MVKKGILTIQKELKMADNYISTLLKMLWDIEHTPEKLIVLEAKIIMGEADYDYSKCK